MEQAKIIANNDGKISETVLPNSTATDEQIESAAGNLAGGPDRFFREVGASVAPSVCDTHTC